MPTQLGRQHLRFRSVIRAFALESRWLGNRPGWYGALMVARTHITPTFVALCLIACGADRDADPSDPEPNTPASERAVPSEQTSPYPRDLSTFADDVAAYEGRDECLSEMTESLPGALSDLLADLTYAQVALDACISLEAAAEDNAVLCAELATRGLETGCRRRAAVHHKRPADCPQVRDAPDVMCLAWATGRAELCVASDDPAMCSAVALNDASECDDARMPSTCRSQVVRFGSHVEGAMGERLSSSCVGSLQTRAAGQPNDSPQNTQTLEFDVERGLVVEHAPLPCRHILRIEGRGRPRIEARLEVSANDASAEGTYWDERAIVGAPFRGRWEGEVELELGGAIRGTVEATIRQEGQEIALQMAVDSFIRGWVTPCGDSDL